MVRKGFSDGSTKDATSNLGVKDDMPFFGKVISVGEGGIDIRSTNATPASRTTRRGLPQGDADDVLIPNPIDLLGQLEDRVTDAGFSLPFGDSKGLDRSASRRPR